MFNYNLFMGGNKYNARTEMQYKFAQRVENQFNLICDFDTYRITRGRGLCKADGCCSSFLQVKMVDNNRTDTLCLYEPMRNYLVKKRYLILGEWCGDLALYVADKPETEERWS